MPVQMYPTAATPLFLNEGAQLFKESLLLASIALLAAELAHRYILKDTGSFSESVGCLGGAVVAIQCAQKSPAATIFALALTSFATYFISNRQSSLNQSAPSFLIDMMVADHPQQAYIVGNEDRIQDLVRALRTPGKPHAMLVGQTGVGKTALIYGIAQMLKDKKIDKGSFLDGKKIFLLDKNSFLSNISYVGQLQTKIKELVDFTKQNRDVIVVCDEFQALASAGTTQNNPQSVTQFLKEPIENEDIRLIAATTEIEYRTFVEIDAPLARRFQRVDISEMKPTKCLDVLKHRLQTDTKNYQGISFTEEALQAIIVLTSLLDFDVGQPDKALTLMGSIATYVDDWEDKMVTLQRVAEIYSIKLQKKYNDMTLDLLLNMFRGYLQYDRHLEVLSTERIQNHLQRLEEERKTQELARRTALLRSFAQQQGVLSGGQNDDSEESY